MCVVGVVGERAQGGRGFVGDESQLVDDPVTASGCKMSNTGVDGRGPGPGRWQQGEERTKRNPCVALVCAARFEFSWRCWPRSCQLQLAAFGRKRPVKLRVGGGQGSQDGWLGWGPTVKGERRRHGGKLLVLLSLLVVVAVVAAVVLVLNMACTRAAPQVQARDGQCCKVGGTPACLLSSVIASGPSRLR